MIMGDRYSARNGFIAIDPQRQSEDLDEKTRNALWNAIAFEVGRSVNRLGSVGNAALLSSPGRSIVMQAAEAFGPKTIRLPPFVQRLWVEHWESRTSEVAGEAEADLIADVEEVVVGGDLPAIFDVIEILIQSVTERDKSQGEGLIAAINKVFRRRNVAFLLTDGLVLPLSDEIESQAVERALANAADISGPHQQLRNAARHLRDGNWADSVSSALKAAEGTAQSVLSDNRVPLGRAVDKLSARGHIDSDIAATWNRLYGWASNAKNNIRHGGIHEANVSPALAAYFLVTTSAFVSYLLSLPQAGDQEPAPPA
jgi:hypothetical protein